MLPLFILGDITLLIVFRIGADRYEKAKKNVELRRKQFGIRATAKPHPMYKHSGKLRYENKED